MVTRHGSAGLDARVRDAAERAAQSRDLSVALAGAVVEQILERPDARLPTRSLPARVPALAIAVSARAVDLGARAGAAEALPELAALAIATFVDAGAIAVIPPGHGPAFLVALPDCDEPVDEVTALCRRLDDEQVRARAVARAERFRAELERRGALRGLVVELRLGEGAIVDAPTPLGPLLPAAAWQPA